MAEGTLHSLIAEVVSILKGKIIHLREEQERVRKMLEAVLQKINNLSANSEQLAVKNRNQNSGEGSSNQDLKVSNNPSFDRNKGIQAKTLWLYFHKFDRFEPMECTLK